MYLKQWESHGYPFEHIRVCMVTSALASAITTPLPLEKQPQTSVLSLLSPD